MTSRAATAPFPRHDVTPPADWDRWAASLDDLDVDAAHATVIAPHPDDETFGCGGLVAGLCGLGAEVTVVTASDGAASHPEVAGLGARRRAEQAAALGALGCRTEPVWLGLPDGDLATHEPALRAGIRDVVAGADLVIAPWAGDGHPDHEVVGRTAALVARRCDVRLVSYPVWVWRWGGPQDLAGSRCLRWPLGDAARRAKRTAIGCYPTQTTDLVGEVIVDPAMVERFSRPFEVFLDG
ncbi:PIG-L deacetylase family protein [Aquihabitans daechungensis]|uniref:PIG-L deacetylase family protein n=1 Tax=Aquihabitans daechungensis TaxID=1052257 RepID=UPI003BA20084